MRPIALAVMGLLFVASIQAQSVPGRDLLFSPLGLTGEPAAFGGGPAAGLWNPATGRLPDDSRFQFALAALNAPVDLAFTGQVLNAGWRVPRVGSIRLSVARAGVADLVRTDTDPQSIGGDVPYSIWVTSIGFARRVHPHVTLGVASRVMAGQVDRARGRRVATDVGIVVDSLTRADVRVAASSFLWAVGATDRPSIAIASDARLIRLDESATLRGGVGLVHTDGATTEVYPFLAARIGRLDVRGGPVHVAGFEATTWRSRLAVVLQQDAFTIGVAREANAAGLTPTYQLSIVTQR
jgi:hypothetical protein